ncbi:hypothetical protein CASFOL_041570 [Castilleja foliolosa]|uniref:Ubiquitin-like protease family profile domain-containing protein n=1 Tax=Castilleja foliolosa TaxID=1961234 RepID=A0ABD3BB36_9LAMI
MASADKNNMSIELYKPSQVGETDTANPTNAANPTINADSNPANAADSSTTISDNHNTDSTTGWEWRCQMLQRFRESLRFGPTNFDPNEDCDLPMDGVYMKFIDPVNKFGKKGAEYEFVFELFMNAPRNLKKSRESLLKIAKVLFVHDFFYAIDKRHRIANWLWVLVEREDDAFYCRGCTWFGGYNSVEAKTQVRPATLLKRLFLKKSLSLYLDFFDKQPMPEKLEPTKQELIDYTWWPHVDDDVRSSVNYIHKESNAKKTTLKRTLEQSSVPPPGQGDGSITAEEVRPQKRCRTTERPNVDSGELLTRILEGVRQENELLEQRLMREMHEIEERAARKSDDLRSEIEKLKKTVEELQRHNNYQTKTGKIAQSTTLKRQKAQGQTNERKKPPPPPSAVQDDLYMPFDDNFIDEIELQRGLVKKAKANPKFLTIRRVVRPPKDSEPHTYIIDKNSKHMKAYIAYLESNSKEARDCGTGMCQYEDASYFKEVEDPGKCMDIQTIDSYLWILHLNPEFLGCHPEARDKYLIYPSIFCAFLAAISQSMYHNNIASAIRDEDKGQMEELNLENDSVKILLDLVQGKPVELIESWGPFVPITAVDKIYICEVWVIDSMANLTAEDKRVNRYEGTMCLRRILPALLQVTGFYDKRKDLKPVNREWDLRFADKDQCLLQTDGVSCRPFSCKMMEVLVSRRPLPNITEENTKFIRRGIAERIFSFSKPAPES